VDKIQTLIQKGIEEGATLVAGGPGLPEGVNKGFYCAPTIFADVTNDMTIAREKSLAPCSPSSAPRTKTTRCGSPTIPVWSGWNVSADTVESARKVGRRSAPATSNLQGVPNDRPRRSAATSSPGNGANGQVRLEEYLEVKAVAVTMRA